MSKIYQSVEELIGHTPLMEIKRIEEKLSLYGRVLIKLEQFNPAGSAKDRVAVKMLDDAEKAGIINKNSVIIEPTSGNTGIGLAAVGAARGYRVIIVMPDTMSKERQRLMTAYGAELVLSDGKLGMTGAIKKAEELAASIPDSYIPGQFTNRSNPEAHRLTTGPEIYEDADGKVDIFIAGAGTGGTLTGVGEYLKSKNPDVKIVAVEPANSPFLSKGVTGSHNLQGIGAGFLPEIMNMSVIDAIVPVWENDAYETARLLGRTEGILTGISAGAALFTGIALAKDEANAGKNIVVLLPDTGDRYLSTELYEE